MNNTTPKFNYLQQMGIIIKMETALAGAGGMVTHCLKQAILTKQPASLIIKTTQDMIRDNEPAMGYILGQSLCERIKNFDL